MRSQEEVARELKRYSGSYGSYGSYSGSSSDGKKHKLEVSSARGKFVT